jgi:flagellar M-ring protein FliF
MDQLRQLLASLSVKQRITVLIAAVLVGGGIMLFSHWKRENDFRPLYTGLTSEDAGTVVQRLRESGTEFRLPPTGDSVLVPSEKLAETRLEMAAAGLPKSGRIGFELFDKTSFGTTEFVEQINYRRALEGELERSVMCLSEVEKARVHITFPKDSVYLDARQPAKASVMVRLRPGAQMAPQNVQAIVHLVASAVEGLSADAVSVMDMNGSLLARARTAGTRAGEYSEQTLDFQQSVEKSLVAKVNATLEPLLGAGKFRAGASVECDFTSGQQSEETYDPNRSVMLTSQTTEDATGGGSAADSAAGIPGTASALPNPAPKPVVARAGTTRKSENVTYQSSRVVRQTTIPSGTIKRVSIAVLVDQAVSWQTQGTKKVRVLVPPTPETLKAIRDVVVSATGLNTERGDQFTIESLPFESTLNAEPPEPEPGAPTQRRELDFWQNLSRNRNMLLMTAGAVAALLMAVRGLFALLFGIARKKKRVLVAEQPALEPPTQRPGETGLQAAAQVNQGTRNAPALATFAAAGREDGSLVVQIRDSVRQNSDLSVSVVRSWLGQREPGAARQ